MLTVYKIWNKVNDKLYIGITKHSLRYRFTQHKMDSQNPKKQHRSLFKAFNEIGIENFFIEAIEQVPDELRTEKERYWIDFYDTYRNGYNDTYGGVGRPVGDVKEIIRLYKIHQSIPIVAKLSGVCWDTVQYILHENNIPIKTPQQIQKDRVPNIAMYSIEGKLLRIFDSICTASDFVHEYNGNGVAGLRRHIGLVCRGKRKTAGGFKWKYTKRKPKVYVEID